MKKAIAFTLSLSLLAVLAAPASGGEPIPTEVIIRDNAPAFHGKVKSDESECYVDRTVSLFRVKEGPNKLLGEDQTDMDGKWEVLEPDEFTLKSGVYYAKAFRTSLESGTVCGGDKSEKVVVD